jgi:DNA primase
MDFVQQLKSSVDIVKIIGDYVRLKKVGSSPRYMGLCPFHTEKTPSFSVHTTLQIYKCFGCGVGGDVLKFLMEIERITFYEALKLVSDRSGIPIPRRAEYSDPDTKLRAALYQMHEIAARLFHDNLRSPAGAEARTYLERRGVKPELIEEFGLGYSDRGGQTLVRHFQHEGFSAETIEASKLCLKRQDGSGFFDMFRHRLMFPIHNESGKIIAFGARALAADEEPKYLNSSESEIYKKGFVLYNLHRAKQAIRKNDRSVLVEGYMDVIGVHAAGVQEVVAPCGTAFKDTQARSLKRHSERIVVNFDPDAAGAGAAERSIRMLLDEGMHVRVLQLDDGLDPDEYVKDRGAGAYREKLDHAPGYVHWLADRARARFDMRDAEGRVAAFKFLLPSIQSISDKIERAAVANDVAGYLGIDGGLVLEQFRRASIERRETKFSAPTPSLRPNEKMLLHGLVSSPGVRREILPLLREMPTLARLASQHIFQVILSLSDTQGDFQYSELEARLEESERALLASALFDDEVVEESALLDRAYACLRTLEAEDRIAQRSRLRTRIKEAERAGDGKEVMRLAEELDQMGKA